MAEGIRIKDLPPWAAVRRVETPHGPVWIEAEHPSLYCTECGEHTSANPGDYWEADPETVITCCGEPVRLVRRRVVLEDVTT